MNSERKKKIIIFIYEVEMKIDPIVIFLFKQVLVYRSMCEYHQFQRQHMLYHQEHVQHDNDHRLLVLDDMVDQI